MKLVGYYVKGLRIGLGCGWFASCFVGCITKKAFGVCFCESSFFVA